MIENVEELVDALAEETRAHVEKRLGELRAELVAEFTSKMTLAMADIGARFEALPKPVAPEKGEPGERGEPGPHGAPGKDAVVDYDRIGDVIALAVDKAIANVERPKDGAPGKDGVVDYTLVREFVTAAAINAVAALPKPADGKSVTLDDVRPLIDDCVTRAVSALPKPKDGADGKDGEPGPVGPRGEKGDAGERGEPGERGIDGANGRDGSPGKDADAALVEPIVERALSELVQPALAALQTQVKRLDEAPKFDPATLPKALEVSEVQAIAERVANERFAAVPPIPDERAVDLMIDRRLADAAKAFEPVAAAKPDDVAPLIEREVERRFAALPKPKDGESVHPDTVARLVAETVEKRFATLRLPQDGKPGRDALDIEILEVIDPQRSYPGGTFALHDGGMVLAVRDTDPLGDDLEAAGWKVTQDGIKGIEREECADERMTRVVVVSTSGKRFAVDCLTAPGLKDKGVHRPGMRYRAGDAVTFDESYWVCRKDTQTSPPGEDWRLILKGKRRP